MPEKQASQGRFNAATRNYYEQRCGPRLRASSSLEELLVISMQLQLPFSRKVIPKNKKCR